MNKKNFVYLFPLLLIMSLVYIYVLQLTTKNRNNKNRVLFLGIVNCNYNSI